MKRFLGILFVPVFLALGSVLLGSAGEGEARPPDDSPSFRSEDNGEEFVPDQLIVKLKAGEPQEDLEKLNRENNASTEDKISRLRLNVVKLPEDLSVEEAEEIYEASPYVEYAEPDYVLTASSKTANDAEFSYLYGLNNTGQTGGDSDADIDAPEAWGVTTGGAETVVAVIDSGVDISHPELKNNVWTNTDEVPNNRIDDDKNGYVDDVNGWDFVNNDASVFDSGDDPHGTHVAGTIAAEGNNNVGVVGVHWWAQIMPLKFLGPDGSGSTSNAIKALDYAVANGAKISNNSYGGVGGYSLSFSLALKKADTAGHLFVAAAGNGGADGIGDDNDTTPSYPASYDVPNVVSVAATDNKDALAGFSNYGATSVDLAAPGVAIRSTLPNSTYGTYSGTSMATPHVAGVAALIKSKGPTLDDAGIKAKLLGSADKKPNPTGKEATGGRLNAGQAVDAPPWAPAAATPPPATVAPPPPVAATPPPSSTLPVDNHKCKGKKGEAKKKCKKKKR